MSKWVYFFGDGKAEGTGKMKELLGGKGANLAEMTSLSIPVPPGFTITTEVCTYYYENGKSYPADLKGQAETALKDVEEIDGHAVRRPQEPPACLGPLGRAQVHARHDGDRPERRPLPEDHPRPDRQDQEPALRLRRLPPPDHDVLGRGHGEGRRASSPAEGKGIRQQLERMHGRGQEGQGLRARHRPHRRGPQGARASSSRPRSRRSWARSSRTTPMEQLWGGIGAVFASLERQARHLLPPHRGHPGRVGHRGQRAVHGLRQHGRHLGHRRGLHAQPGHRREQVLRRVAGQRAGRGRGGRHPHAQPAQRGDRSEQNKHLPSLEKAMPRGLQAAGRHPADASKSTTATCRTSSSRSRRARCGCSSAAIGKRNGTGRAQHGDGHAGRGADHHGKKPSCA